MTPRSPPPSTPTSRRCWPTGRSSKRCRATGWTRAGWPRLLTRDLVKHRTFDAVVIGAGVIGGSAVDRGPEAKRLHRRLLGGRALQLLDLDRRRHSLGVQTRLGGLGRDWSTVLAHFDRARLPYEGWNHASIRARMPLLDTGRYYPPKPIADEAFWDEPFDRVRYRA